MSGVGRHALQRDDVLEPRCRAPSCRSDRRARRRSAATQPRRRDEHGESHGALPQKILLKTRISQPGRQAVLDQALAEGADAQLPDRVDGTTLPGWMSAGRDDAGQHDDLPVAVDVDLAHAFDDEVAVRQHLDDARGHHRRRARRCAWCAPLPLNCVLAADVASSVGSNQPELDVDAEQRPAADAAAAAGLVDVRVGGAATRSRSRSTRIGDEIVDVPARARSPTRSAIHGVGGGACDGVVALRRDTAR